VTVPDARPSRAGPERAAPLPALTDEALLAVWEAGVAALPTRRPAALVAAALPGCPVPPERLPVGTRDTLLLALRVGTFGAALEAVASCPGCCVPVDVSLDAAEVLAALPAPELDLPAPEHLDVDGTVLELRLPDTLDLEAAGACPEAELARALLARRCVRSLDGRAVTPAALALASDCMAASDPAADLTLAIRCPDCDHAWSAPLDVADFLWAELNAAAVGILVEVDQLATRYGWSEREIVCMSPVRRRSYLELA
jgi:hypothetical protein